MKNIKRVIKKAIKNIPIWVPYFVFIGLAIILFGLAIIAPIRLDDVLLLKIIIGVLLFLCGIGTLIVLSLLDALAE